MRCYRQGDVVLRELKKLPKPAELEDGRPLLALGEETGHSHRLEGGAVQFYSRGETTYIEVFEETTLVHEEHRALKIPPGTYVQHAEREYDYFTKAQKLTFD